MNFIEPTDACKCNDNLCRCCMTKAQIDVQIETLYCNATQEHQNCSCTNVTTAGKPWSWSCNCTMPETNVTKLFNYANQKSCLCKLNEPNCDCCVAFDQ